MDFSSKDKEQIENRGSNLETVNTQIENFKKGFPFLKAIRAAAIQDGILALQKEQIDSYVELYEKKSSSKKLLKFVPASGAASRMFKSLFSAKDEDKMDASVDQFFEKLSLFAFASKLDSKKTKKEILAQLLDKDGLNYGQLPKGLLDFHTYGGTIRTAIEEHLVEGALYASSKGKINLHFTVSPEHKKSFQSKLKEVLSRYTEQYKAKYVIDFSEQKPSTDTIAVDNKNQPFRDANGNILFRPAGHGALIENLNDLDADIIFIKNIDNVVPDHLKTETVQYKKALAGLLIDFQTKIFNFIKKLSEETYSVYSLRKASNFLRNSLCIEPPKGYRAWADADKRTYVLEKLQRPLRICGMVKNVGEPGGGPFWVKNQDGSKSLQVVESAQINLNNAQQKTIFSGSTHFNPVDLICATKNHKKEKYNLLNFTDPSTGFITEKSQSGKVLKAQELPGLWNGAMANWNTVFVEVPLITFNPVKTVNDLLRKEHQPG
ncbi:MAG: DUF4301 family protein [Leadbetterella sp.]